MKIRIMIGEIIFLFESDFEVLIEESLKSFLYQGKEREDVFVKWSIMEKQQVMPQGKKVGEDLLLEYYDQGEETLCLAKGSKRKYLSTTFCDKNFRNLKCQLHFQPQNAMQSLGNLLRLIPMCKIFQYQKVNFFHASQIAVKNKGILFTAPSGTGKTTQSKLWRDYRDAKIVCNDRTLVRKGKTYGYPIDGSEPVCSDEIYSLGAIVLLEKGKENVIVRLKPKDAIVKLIPQLVVSGWDSDTWKDIVEQLIFLAENYPVYLLKCVPDQTAVECLEKRLKLDGVL